MKLWILGYKDGRCGCYKKLPDFWININSYDTRKRCRKDVAVCRWFFSKKT